MTQPPRRRAPARDAVGRDRGTAAAREEFMSGQQMPRDSVRSPILASWHRSQGHRVSPDRVEPPPGETPTSGSPLARAAAPVLRNLFDALAGQAISIVLTDQRGLVLTRVSDDPVLNRRLDSVGLAPGYVYAEEYVGTNGIGTALETGAPTIVLGHEHYAERLEDLACAGVPIHHPVTGRTVGVIDLTCWRRDAGSLLLTLATSTAGQIQDAFRDQTDVRDRLLFSEYLRTGHRSGGIVLAVGPEGAMLNEHARALLQAADQAALMARATELLDQRRGGIHDVTLPGGSLVRMHCQPVRHHDALAGLVVRVSMAEPRERRPAHAVRGATTAAPLPLPGLVGRAPVWLRSCHDVERRFLAGEWVAVVGERGVGKQSLLRAVQLRRQPSPRVAVLDAAEGGVPGWVGRLRAALGGGADSVVLTHVEQLKGTMLRTVQEALHAARSGAGPAARWVGVTATGDGASAGVGELVNSFPTTVEMPSLRQHPDDIAALVTHFLARMGDGRPLRCSPEAHAMLTRFSWPGNAHQLQRVLGEVRRHRRSGIIEPDDLPAELHALSRRMLTQMESLERDAIVQALIETDGDKARTAEVLGMSRATIYRRIRAYGIVEQVSPQR